MEFFLDCTLDYYILLVLLELSSVVEVKFVIGFVLRYDFVLFHV